MFYHNLNDSDHKNINCVQNKILGFIFKANIRVLISIDLMIGNYPYPNLMIHTPSMPAF